MSGFVSYIMSALDPMSNLGFSRAIGELAVSKLPTWWVAFVLPLIISEGLPVVFWIRYLVRPAALRPPVPKGQAEPFVSVVIAGRNESATIGQSIRAVLQSGYSNLEVIFVDDHSDDDSLAIARHAALSVTHSSRDSSRVRIFPSPRRNGKASSLNIGIRMARGEFIAITDADSVLQYGSIHHWLVPFADPKVGAVCANCRVLNSRASLVSRNSFTRFTG